jgi:glycogen synthase
VGAWLDARERRLVAAARSASRVVAISKFTGAALAECGVPRNRIATVYVDGAVEEIVPPRVARATGTFAVLAAGRLHEHKGFRTLVEAAADVVKGGTELSVVIAGEGPDRGELERAAAACGLAGRVRFTGRLEAGELAQEYERADVVAVPSLAPEPFGRVAVEAMSRGTPVIASDTGGLREIVRDGETGFLVPPGDPRALAARLRELAADFDLASRLAAGAADSSRRRFAAPVVAADLTRVYEEVVFRS